MARAREAQRCDAGAQAGGRRPEGHLSRTPWPGDLRAPHRRCGRGCSGDLVVQVWGWRRGAHRVQTRWAEETEAGSQEDTGWGGGARGRLEPPSHTTSRAAGGLEDHSLWPLGAAGVSSLLPDPPQSE